jgi:hypothetical protein
LNDRTWRMSVWKEDMPVAWLFRRSKGPLLMTVHFIPTPFHFDNTQSYRCIYEED